MVRALDELSTVDLLRFVYSTLAGSVAPLIQSAGHPQIRRAHESVFVNVEKAGIRLKDLAEKANMTAQAMGELVDELEGLGYLQRVPDANDGRAKLIKLTKSGQEVVHLANQTIARIESLLEELLGRGAKATLRKALIQILTHSSEFASTA